MNQSEDKKHNQRAVKNLYKDMLKYNCRILKVHIVDVEKFPSSFVDSWSYWTLRQGTRQIIVEMEKKC